MRTNYLNTMRTAMITGMLFIGAMVQGQDIHFTFANGQNTSDGVNEYFEIDVMVQTINDTGDLKLGSGQLYFNYNRDAFGEDVAESGGLEVSYANEGGYLCGQMLDGGAMDVYGAFIKNDNTLSRVSWNFSQIFSESTFDASNVTSEPRKLVHLKLRYTNVHEDPMLRFEDGQMYDDQFFTACGSSERGNFDPVDCIGFPGIQLVNDTFDSSGARLSAPEILTDLGISAYPNPTFGMIYLKGDIMSLTQVEILTLTGQRVMVIRNNLESIDLTALEGAVYYMKLISLERTSMVKIIKK